MTKKEPDEKRLMRWLRNEVYTRSRDIGKVNKWFSTSKPYLKGHTPNKIIEVFGIAQLVQTINTPMGQMYLINDFNDHSVTNDLTHTKAATDWFAQFLTEKKTQ